MFMATTRPGFAVSLGTKLAVATVGVLCVVSTALYLELTSRERQHLVSSKTTAAAMVSDLFAASLTAPLDFGDTDAVDAELRNLRSNTEIIYAAVWSGSSPDPIAELRTDRWAASPPGRAQANETAVFVDRVELSRVVTGRKGGAVGGTRLVFSLAPENAEFDANRTRIFWWSLAMTGATALILIVIARRQIIGPLAKVAEGARRLERGELGARVDITSRDEIGSLAQAFNSMGAAIADREQSLDAARKDLRDLFDNMRQAIVAFGSNGLVEGQASRQAFRLFGQADLAGKSMRELLYPGASTHDVDASAFEEWMGLAFDVPSSAWGEVASLAPSEIELRPAGAEPIPLELEFRPVMAAGKVRRIMLLATDITERRRLERTVQSQEQDHARQMAAMRRLMAGGAQVFVSFMDSARHRISRCLSIIGPTARMLRSGEIDELFRHVHTIKGEAKGFDMRDLEIESAKLEEELDELRASARGEGFATTGSVHALLASRFTRASEAIDRGAELFVAAAPTGRAALDQVTVQRSDVLELLSLLGERSDALGRVGVRLAARPFGEATVNLAEMAPTWADGEGKRARVQIEGKEVQTPPHLAKVLRGVLLHLVRNAVIHGIETPKRREQAGKPPTGLIQVTAEPGSGGPTIIVEDDGKGLDLAHIAERAQAIGQSTAGEVGDLAFLPGLSTLEKAGDLGGRGVGLAAVRAELAEAGYAVEARSEAGRFTRFVMRPDTLG